MGSNGRTVEAKSVFDLSAFERDGVLTERDYMRVANLLSERMRAVRVPSIRKGLNFRPDEFADHERSALADFDKRSRPAFDPELAFDLATVPITLTAEFNVSFFPDFMREYDHPGARYSTFSPSSSMDGSVLGTGNFPSLLLAAHQIEQVARDQYNKTPIGYELEASGLEVEVQFLAPATTVIELAQDLKAVLTFFILFED